MLTPPIACSGDNLASLGSVCGQPDIPKSVVPVLHWPCVPGFFPLPMAVPPAFVSTKHRNTGPSRLDRAPGDVEFLAVVDSSSASPPSLETDTRDSLATFPSSQHRIDTSKHYNVFVGDLSPEIDEQVLYNAFAPFGQISVAKVIRDFQTLKCKGYGFVSFVQREDAERAIEQMNGQVLGTRNIRTNWATRKSVVTTTGDKDGKLEEILSQANPTNCTVYIGGLGGTTTENDLRQLFTKYGTVVDVRLFCQQGYAFVRYNNHDSAGQAIYNLHNTDINGAVVRCGWGKEGRAMHPSNVNVNYAYEYGVGGGGQPNFRGTAEYQTYSDQYHQYYGNSPVVQWRGWMQCPDGYGGAQWIPV